MVLPGQQAGCTLHAPRGGIHGDVNFPALYDIMTFVSGEQACSLLENSSEQILYIWKRHLEPRKGREQDRARDQRAEICVRPRLCSPITN